MAEMDITSSPLETALATPGENFTFSTNATIRYNASSNVVTDSGKTIIRVIYVLVFLVGVLGNSIVCYIILKNKRRKRIDIFILNLAFSDLFVLFIYLPLQMTLFEHNMKWIFGNVFCKITYSVIPVSFFSSIGTLIAITRDRYIAVLTPMKIKVGYKTRWTLILIWLVSVILTIPLMYASDLVHGFCTEANWPNIDIERGYWIMVFCVQFALPVCFISITYSIILVHLKINSLPAERHNLYLNRYKTRRRQHHHMTFMTIVLVFVYVICMLPQHMVFFWLFYGNLQTIPYRRYIFLFANLMAIANSSLNPIVYGTLNKEMKRGIKMVLHCNYRHTSEYERTPTSRRTTTAF